MVVVGPSPKRAPGVLEAEGAVAPVAVGVGAERSTERVVPLAARASARLETVHAAAVARVLVADPAPPTLHVLLAALLVPPNL